MPPTKPSVRVPTLAWLDPAPSEPVTPAAGKKARVGTEQLTTYNKLAGIKAPSKRWLPKPTLRQMIILRILDKWIREHDGQCPSIRELAAAAACKSTRTVTEHIFTLRRKGLVVNLPREMRTIFLTTQGELALAAYKFPDYVDHIKLV